MTDAQLCALLVRLRDHEDEIDPASGDWPAREDLLAAERAGLIVLGAVTRALCESDGDTPLRTEDVDATITLAGRKHLEQNC